MKQTDIHPNQQIRLAWTWKEALGISCSSERKTYTTLCLQRSSQNKDRKVLHIFLALSPWTGSTLTRSWVLLPHCWGSWPHLCEHHHPLTLFILLSFYNHTGAMLWKQLSWKCSRAGRGRVTGIGKESLKECVIGIIVFMRRVSDSECQRTKQRDRKIHPLNKMLVKICQKLNMKFEVSCFYLSTSWFLAMEWSLTQVCRELGKG